MSKHMDRVLPYLWIIGLATLAIIEAPSWLSLFPALVCGMWIGALLCDKYWAP